MTPINIQVSRSKVRVKGQAYSLYVWEGGISVLQTSIFTLRVATVLAAPVSTYVHVNQINHDIHIVNILF